MAATTAASSSIAHDLRQFRYITSAQRPVPWSHVRHVCIPELRNEAPDLPLLTHLISGLSDCDLSLKEVREHNDADLLQLLEVLQACLQFVLWSQNILKERLLELQSSQAARRVSARQLDSLEARHQALVKEVAALTSERDTLSLGTANLRTSVVQMETTIKMQERQLKQERERTSMLLGKLEKALADNTAARTAPMPPPTAPAAGHEEAWARDARGRLCCPTCGSHRHTPQRPRRSQAAKRSAQASLSDTDTSYTDSLLCAEGEVCCAEGRRRRGGSTEVFPSPCLDWRTLVRYILHEERRTPQWPSPPPPTEGAAVEAAAKQQQLIDQLPALIAAFTAAVTEEVGAFTRTSAAETRDAVLALSQQQQRRMLAEMQRALVDELRPRRADPTAASRGSEAGGGEPSAFAAPLHMDLPSLSSVPSTLQATAAAETFVRAVEDFGGTSLRHDHSVSINTIISPMLKTEQQPDGTRKEAAAAAPQEQHYQQQQPAPSAASHSGSDHQPGVPGSSHGAAGGGEGCGSDRNSTGGLHSSPHRSSQPPSAIHSPSGGSLLPERRSFTGSPNLRYTVSSSVWNSRASSLPVFSPDILRTPPHSPPSSHSAAAPSSSSSSSSSSEREARRRLQEMDQEMHRLQDEEEEGDDDDDAYDAQSPDADFRLPSSSSTSPSSSERSSLDGPVMRRRRSGSGSDVTAAPSPAASAYKKASGSAPRVSPYVKPASTPPVYPALSGRQAGSPLTATPASAAAAGAGGFSLYRTGSLQSSMRSDASGGSTHASSQMLRDTQRELEALLAEDAAAERAKAQSRK